MERLNKLMEDKGLSEDEIIKLIETADNLKPDKTIEEDSEKEQTESTDTTKTEEEKEEKPKPSEEKDIEKLIEEEVRKHLKIKRAPPPEGEIVDKGVGESELKKEKFSIYV